MKNLYVELKNRHQEEVNNFPMAFAFSDKQFEEGMLSLGLQPHETDEVIDIGGGGFIRKSDRDAYINLNKRIEEEMRNAIEDVDTGEQFIFDMVRP